MAAIELRGVRKSFGRLTVLDGLDLTVEHGTLLGLIGLNGAGKSTTIAILLGLLRADAGTSRILGTASADVAKLSGRVGAALHRPGLEPQLTVRDNLRLHALCHGRAHRQAAAVPLLERLELAHLRDRKVARLSQGERQRLALARAVLLEPELLILDEPLSHLDPGAVEGVLALLTDEVERRGATVLLSSHQLEHVERAAHRLAVLHRGRVLAEGPVQELLTRGLRGHAAAPGAAAPAAAAGAAFLVGVDAREPALRLLAGHALVGSVDVVDDGHVHAAAPAGNGRALLRVRLKEPRPEQINAALHRAGIGVSLLRPEQVTLNDLFKDAVLADKEARR